MAPFPQTLCVRETAPASRAVKNRIFIFLDQARHFILQPPTQRRIDLAPQSSTPAMSRPYGTFGGSPGVGGVSSPIRTRSSMRTLGWALLAVSSTAGLALCASWGSEAAVQSQSAFAAGAVASSGRSGGDLSREARDALEKTIRRGREAARGVARTAETQGSRVVGAATARVQRAVSTLEKALQCFDRSCSSALPGAVLREEIAMCVAVAKGRPAEGGACQCALCSGCIPGRAAPASECPPRGGGSSGGRATLSELVSFPGAPRGVIPDRWAKRAGSALASRADICVQTKCFSEVTALSMSAGVGDTANPLGCLATLQARVPGKVKPNPADCFKGPRSDTKLTSLRECAVCMGCIPGTTSGVTCKSYRKSDNDVWPAQGGKPSSFKGMGSSNYSKFVGSASKYMKSFNFSKFVGSASASKYIPSSFKGIKSFNFSKFVGSKFIPSSVSKAGPSSLKGGFSKFVTAPGQGLSEYAASFKNYFAKFDPGFQNQTKGDIPSSASRGGDYQKYIPSSASGGGDYQKYIPSSKSGGGDYQKYIPSSASGGGDYQKYISKF